MFNRAGLPIRVHSAKELGGMPYVEEITGTFTGNCRLKGEALRRIAPAKSWVLADDSGLCCDALQGGPGVDSAVYAGKGASDAQNRQKLLSALKKAPAHQRGARFECHLLLLGPNREEQKFLGQCWGRILEQEVGTGGLVMILFLSRVDLIKRLVNFHRAKKIESVIALKLSSKWSIG